MRENLDSHIANAIAASQTAYVPYSNYPVGAYLVTADGVGYTGCNVENASYPATICAERTALVKAVSEGAREFAGIIIATANGGSPCGVCRQMLYEFSPHMTVITVTFEGDIVLDTTLDKLLLAGFGPSNLPPRA